MSRIYSIGALRFIASSAVVLSHISHKAEQNFIESLTWYNFKGFGVDLFFILSGFIICYTTFNKDYINVFKFLKNRVTRLIPLYWFFTTIAVLIFIYKPSLINSSGGNTNIIASYFLLPIGDKFLINNAWTLTYDFLFYLIFCFCLIFFAKKYVYFLCSLIILIIVSIGIYFKINLFLFNVLMLEFVLGILVYFIFRKIKLNNFYSFFLIFSGCFIIIYQNYFGAIESVLGRSFNRGIPIFLIFLGFVYLDKYFNPEKNLIAKFFSKMGDSSYSIFLSHPFTLVLASKFFIFISIDVEYYSLFLYLMSIFFGYMVYSHIEIKMTKFIKSKLN